MSHNIRCEICGKFIGYNEIYSDTIKVEFTPDTDYTTESVEFYHKTCLIIRDKLNKKE